MKTQMRAATFSDLAPGKANGATARPIRIASSTKLSQRLFGRSSERSDLSIALPLRHGIEALRPPQQDQRHQEDVRAQRHLGREEADVISSEADQQRADETAAHRAQPADDDH